MNQIIKKLWIKNKNFMIHKSFSHDYFLISKLSFLLRSWVRIWIRVRIRIWGTTRVRRWRWWWWAAAWGRLFLLLILLFILFYFLSCVLLVLLLYSLLKLLNVAYSIFLTPQLDIILLFIILIRATWSIFHPSFKIRILYNSLWPFIFIQCHFYLLFIHHCTTGTISIGNFVLTLVCVMTEL